jgi:hypothetical protein
VHLGTPHLAQGPPLFGFLCAGLYWMFGDSPLSVILAQIGASALIPVVIARIATEVGLGWRLAPVAGVLAVVHPGLIVYAVGKLHPLSFDALLLSLSVLSVMRLVPASGLGPHVWAGFVLGLATLSRAAVSLFVLPAAACQLENRGRVRRAHPDPPEVRRGTPRKRWGHGDSKKRASVPSSGMARLPGAS